MRAFLAGAVVNRPHLVRAGREAGAVDRVAERAVGGSRDLQGRELRAVRAFQMRSRSRGEGETRACVSEDCSGHSRARGHRNLRVQRGRT